jgi:hypothetical protein
MRGRDQRPGLSLGVERAAESDPVRPAGQFGHEVVVDRFLHDQPRPGRADLPGVQEDRRQRQVEGGVEIGIGKNDVGVLAAQLQSDPLHRGRPRRHQPAADGEAAGERHHVDARVLRQQRAHLGSGTQHEVAHAARQARLLQQPHQQDRGGRRELAGLEHEGVPGQ